MIAFAYYILKMVICSGLLFLYYHIALRNKLFHQWNRFYLLITIVLSLLIPCLSFDIYNSEKESTQDIRLLHIVYSADEYVAKINAVKPSLSAEQLVPIAYSFSSVVVLLFFVLALLRIRSIIRSNAVMAIDDIKFISTEEKDAPFSFFRYIFWNKQIELQSSSGEHIFQHELVHVREKHSLDKIFLQLVLIAFWCNPFFWLIRKELRMIHEFIADKKSIGQSDARAFAAMILQAAYPKHYNHLTNQFFNTSIKRRLLMLTKNTTPKISYLSRVLALPLMVFVILAFTVKQKKENEKNMAETTNRSAITEEIKSMQEPRSNNKNDLKAVIAVSAANKKDSSTPNPLIVIDGKEVGKKNTIDLNRLISPEKIKSITVLKGETAKAKYGKKGEDGIIEIVTKKETDAKTSTDNITSQNYLETPPLVIINGKESGKIKELSPNQIESINVLKGEAATAVYGKKAKGGAILITTKSLGNKENSKEVKEVILEDVKIMPAQKKDGQNDLNEVVIIGYGKNDEASNKIFEKAEKEPEFPGGVSAWLRYLQRNLNAQVPASNKAPYGTYKVIVRFIVGLDGSISEIKAMTSHGYGMEEEVIRVISRGPKWIPAQQNGKDVIAWKSQPITFVVSAP